MPTGSTYPRPEPTANEAASGARRPCPWYNPFMPTRTSMLERIIDHSPAEFSGELARYVLSLGFPAADQQRYAELAEKAQSSAISADERAELEDFLDADDFLAILQSKARATLAKHASAA